LNLRSKGPRRNRAGAHRLERVPHSYLHERWSMDFVSHQPFDGRKFGSFTIVDNYTRCCLDIYPEQGIKGEQVVMVLERLKEKFKAVPEKIRVHNGSEFILKALDKWAYIIHIDHIVPWVD
jgi:putative transposase